MRIATNLGRSRLIFKDTNDIDTMLCERELFIGHEPNQIPNTPSLIAALLDETAPGSLARTIVDTLDTCL